MRRAVIDANIWVSGIRYPNSVPAQVIDLARVGRIRSISSRELIDQIMRTLVKLGTSADTLYAVEWELRPSLPHSCPSFVAPA